MMSLIAKYILSKYLNKAVDFIDLQSIFKDTRVIDQIPKYFQNWSTYYLLQMQNANT